MARARSPDSIQAEKLYKEGMLLVEIARKLGKPEGTVRRWKSTQNWDGNNKPAGKKKENERSDKKASARKPRGAPKGNKNSVGHTPSVPIGNKNALKHGGYSTVYWDTLDEEEMDIVNGIPGDEEELLMEQIALFSVRERRLMKAIAKYKDAKGGQYIAGVMNFEEKWKFKDEEEKELYNEIITEKVKNKERLPGQRYSIQTSTSSAVDLISRLERELTSVQAKKTKAIESLAKLRLEKQKIEGESKGNEFVRTWAESVLKSRRERNGK